MDDSVFSQAIDTTFPNLDSQVKQEIQAKVAVHMIEFLREKVFVDDPQGNEDLLNQIQQTEDKNIASQNYGKAIQGKLLSLPEETREQIEVNCDEELTRVMHQIYKASI